MKVVEIHHLTAIRTTLERAGVAFTDAGVALTSRGEG
jgi:hypothetical protein